MNRQEAMEIAKKMIGLYEKRGGGHHQKLALQILISIAERVNRKHLEEVIADYEIDASPHTISMIINTLVKDITK